MDNVAAKYHKLCVLLGEQSSVAHSLMTNHDAPVFNKQWAEECIARFAEYQKAIDEVKKELELSTILFHT